MNSLGEFGTLLDSTDLSANVVATWINYQMISQKTISK